MLPLACIVAYARNRVIGHRGHIPWHEPDDLRRFKRITMDHAVILGRTSHQAIGRPLPGRRNLVLSRRTDLTLPGCEVVHDLDTAIARARKTDPMPFICGGEQIYRAALPIVTHLHLTVVDHEPTGDAHFPDFDESDFIEVARERSGRCTYRDLVRRDYAEEHP